MLTTEITATMTSREIAKLTGSDHHNMLASIRKLIAEGVISGNETPYQHPQNGVTYTEFSLTFRDTMVVASGYSAELRARIIDRWQELEKAAAAPANPYANLPAEQQALISVMLDNASIKAVQAQQGAAIAAIGQRVDEAVQTQLLMERPTAAESIVHIRERINKLYGLPARIIDQIIRQSPYAPKPAGMVKNQREEAQGSSYAVYWIKDVSAVFARFVRECVHTTATQATHPLVDGRFKLDREH